MKIRLRQLFDAKQALERLFAYRYFPATISFYLKGKRHEVFSPLLDYIDTHNQLLERYGTLEKDGTRTMVGEQAARYRAEHDMLDETELKPIFDSEKFFINLKELDEAEKDIPIAFRLALTSRFALLCWPGFRVSAPAIQSVFHHNAPQGKNACGL